VSQATRGREIASHRRVRREGVWDQEVVDEGLRERIGDFCEGDVERSWIEIVWVVRRVVVVGGDVGDLGAF